MTNPEKHFEAEVGVLLERLADRAVVRPDLDAVLDGRSLAGPGGPPSVAARRSLTIAAALLVLGGGVALFGALSRPDGTATAASERGAGFGALGEWAASPAGEPQVIVWLDVGVDPGTVASLANRLGQRADVESWTYFDTDAAYAEFVEYWADEPEVVALVEPDRVPTSFRVVTADPESLAAALSPLPGVDQVELGEVRDRPSAD